jgi:hypothetical protein
MHAIYAPAHHTPDKVQATAAAAEADKDDEPAAWSVRPKHAPDKSAAQERQKRGHRLSIAQPGGRTRDAASERG